MRPPAPMTGGRGVDCAPMPTRSCSAPIDRRAVLRMLAAGAALAWPALRARQPVLPTDEATTGLPALRLLAHGRLPLGTQFKGTLVGGLSGLAHDAATGLWYALSDDRSRHAPARCYVLRLPPFSAAQPLLPEWVDVITLRDARGRPFPRQAVDPEALALRRDPASGRTSLLWTSEGNVRADTPPALYESALDGRLLRQLRLPSQLREVGTPGRGPRHNETLESLTLTPDGRHAWTAMESALAQDQAAHAGSARPGPCRITRIDLATGRADHEVAYLPEPEPFGPLVPLGAAVSGVSEILWQDGQRLWVLERAWSLATGVSARLYEVDLAGASDTLHTDTLHPGSYRPAAKRLLLNLRDSGLPHVDNFEAMAWGPPLPNGRRTLVMCTDDNFNPLQLTQFVAFEVTSP